MNDVSEILAMIRDNPAAAAARLNAMAKELNNLADRLLVELDDSGVGADLGGFGDRVLVNVIKGNR